MFFPLAQPARSENGDTRPLAYWRRSAHVVDTTMFWGRACGGVRRYLQAKHDWFAGQSMWTHSIAVPSTDSSADVVSLPGMPLPGTGGYRLPILRPMLTQRLQALEPDLVEVGDPYGMSWAALNLRRATGVPIVAFCHSNVELLAGSISDRLAPLARYAARTYVKRLYNQFDLVLAPSLAMQRHLLDWGVRRARVVSLGVDTRAFRPHDGNAAWRRSIGLPPDARVLLYAGRLAPEKQLDVLARAVQRLDKRHWLVTMGAGPCPVRTADCERLISLPPAASLDELARALSSADAFVHAGEQETFGLSVLEAMACGTPVVARAVEGLAELVDESVGMPVRQRGSAAFAEAIENLFERDREALSRAARARAERRDWREVLPLLASHYKDLL